MVDKPNDIEAIYNAALDKASEAQRAAYLDAACGNDSALRARVEALLKAHEDAGSFLDVPAIEANVTLNDSPLTEGPGTVIGPYKLLEMIGEGGMALVYMAEQERPLRRRVALKIIKLGMDTKQVIARFEAERQALAIMDHPNIAKVFDAGATETGRPYFVMELVKGISITEYCDKKKLSTKERLDLFIQVCSAVQHAHQKGIIHRDVKPTNVMVTLRDGKAVPKVIDFGIAKATSRRLTEKTLFTKYAHIIGTPAYMSPEQAEFSEVDIDTRTDIYSLGVLLYELLTGATPFSEEELREAGYVEMQRIILEEEPAKPSTKLSTLGETLTDVAEHRKASPEVLRKLVSGDLDWIVMKTLEKDRTRRYETAAELAGDVERHLSNEPVQAAAPSASYRLRKFIRRNRVGVLVGCLVAFVVLVAVSALSVSTVMVWREKARTETQANRAEANLSLALQALDEIYLEVAKERLPQKAEIEEADRELLQKALKFYEQFAEQNRTVVEARYETAKAYMRVGDIHHTLGEYEQAIEAYLNARQAFEELVDEFPEAADYRKELAESNIKLGWPYYKLNRYEEAEQVCRRAINLAEKLVAEFGDVPAYRMLLVSSYIQLGGVLIRKGELDEAEQAYRSTLPISEELTREFPNVPLYRSGVAASYGNLGTVLRDKGELDEAEQADRSGLAVSEELAREFPDRPLYRSNLATTYTNLGNTLKRRGELDGAGQAHRSALGIFEELAREFPNVPSYRSGLAGSYVSLGLVLKDQGELDEAEQAYRSVLPTYEELAREFPDVPSYRADLATTHNNLGCVLEDKGELDQTKQEYRSAIAIQEKLAREFPSVLRNRNSLVLFHDNLRDVLKDKGELDEVEQNYRSIIAIHAELVRDFPKVPKYRSDLAGKYQNMGDVLTAKGELDKAEQAYRSASAILKELVTMSPEISEYQVRLGASYFNLAWYLVTCVDPQLRDAGRAVELAQKGVEAVPEHSGLRLTLGIAHYRTGRWQEAIAALQKSIELSSGGSSWDFFFLSMAHWQLGNGEEARQWYDKAVNRTTSYDEELRRLLAEAGELLGPAVRKPWATVPQPADGASFDAILGGELRWMPGLDVITHKVYFGSDPENLTLLAQVENAIYAKLPTLEKRRWYCWRVDSVKSDGSVTEGKLWSFATGNMVGWWKFDETESETLTDSSGNGNAGTVVGEPQWVAGRDGGALEFDGVDDYVDCGNDPSLDITNAVTVLAWIKLSGPAYDRKVVGNQDGNAGGYKMSCFSNKLEFEIRDSKNKAIISRQVAGGTVLQPDVWYHVAGVYSQGNRIRTYVNGNLDRELVTEAVLASTSGTLKIGREPFDMDSRFFFKGLIDDVRIYNLALSQAEVAALYKGEGPGPLERPKWITDKASGDKKSSSGTGQAEALLGISDVLTSNGKEVAPGENE